MQKTGRTRGMRAGPVPFQGAIRKNRNAY